MELPQKAAVADVCKDLQDFQLPRWQDLPDFELYMDQVLSLICRYLSAYPGYDGKGLTASMVNNYVKLRMMPAPVKKKYTRSHLAYLLVICLMKSVLPIAVIQQAIASELSVQSEEAFYNSFCELFETSCRVTAEAYRTDAGQQPTPVLWRAALQAQTEQTLALRIAATLPE